MENLKEERMLILTMLKEGKIVFDEAIKLLGTINLLFGTDMDSNDKVKEERRMILSMISVKNLPVEEACELLGSLITGNKEIQNIVKQNFSKKEEDLGSLTKIATGIVKDIGIRVNNLLDKTEPAFKDTAKKVVKKSTKAAYILSKALNDSIKQI